MAVSVDKSRQERPSREIASARARKQLAGVTQRTGESDAAVLLNQCLDIGGHVAFHGQNIAIIV